MAGHEWEGWFEREEFIGQISDIRVQNLQVEREVVQKRTFTRWINLHLEKCNPPTEVQDLFQDIQDGRILMALLEELSGCQLLHGFKKSSHRIFRLNNIAKVLTFLEERNVKLVSIDAADIADGNASIILGLLWNIILFFQIKELTGNIRSQFPSTSSLCSIPTSSDSDTSHSSTPSEELRGPPGPPGPGHGRAIKKLLQWVQKRTRKYGVAVQDFGKSWTSGLAFLAIIKSIDPSLVDMRRALLRTPRENLEEAFRTAHYTLGIPRLLEPEDVTISRPEEQCIMTYVSQFLEHFPGMDEPEQPSLVIERSVSMGRLNTRDLDQDHQIKNSLDRSRLKKRPHAVDQDRRRQPRAAPRVFLSSVSEDRGFVVSSLSHRPSRAGARSWASEDSLLDQVPAGDGEPQGPGEATTFTVSTSRAPQPSYVRSPLGSPAAAAGGEPVLGSPDSWQEESGLGESPSEGSLCDSCGTAWDVCAAVAAEEARAESPSPASLSADAPPDGLRTPEPFVDEGVGSLGSTESTKDRPEPCAAEADKGEDTGQDDLHVHGSHRAPVHVPEAKAGENKSEPEPEGTECSPIETAPDSVEEPPPLELCSRTETVISEDADSREPAEADRPQSELNKDFITSDPFLEITEPDSVEASGQKDTVCPKKASDLSAESEAIEGQLPTEKTLVRRESSLDNTEWEASCQGKYPLLEDRENTAESEETNNVDFKNSQTQGITNGRGFSGDADGNEHKGSETLGIHDDSHPAKMECPSDDVSQSESLCSSNPQPSQTGAMAPIEIVEGKEEAKSSCDLYFDLTSTVKAEVSSPAEETKMNQNGASTDPPDDCQETSTPASGPFVHPGEDTDGRKGSDSGPAGASSRGPTADEDAKVDSFYTNMESSSPSEEPFGEALEPMDLFYPDKEDGMLAEPAEANTEFPPSVFGVFALQPAPPSEPLQPETDPTWEETDANPPTVSDQDSSSGGKMALGLMEEGNDRECDSRQPPGAAPILSSTAAMGGTASLEQEGPAEDGPLRGEEGGVRGHSVVKGNTEPTSGDEEHSRRPGDDLVPTVLRHRKANSVFTSSDKQRIVPIIQINSNTADLGEDSLDGREMYLLFLLWLLLYCLWLLPQMELRALPSLLFNLDP